MGPTTPDTLFGPIFVAAAFHLPPHLSSTHCCAVISWPWSVTWQLGNLGVGHHHLSHRWPGEVSWLGITIVMSSWCCQLAEINKFSTKEWKKYSPVSEVVVDTEKKLKFQNVQVHFKLRSNFFSQKRKKSWTCFLRDHGLCAAMDI